MTAERPPRTRTGPVGDSLVTDPRQRRAILIAVSLALLAVVASVTGLNVAQPALAVDFGASQSTVVWIMNGYVLSLAALLLPMGAAGDRWGRKPVLTVGLAAFAVTSAAAAVAPTAGVMIAARVLNGASAAMIMPVTLAVITSNFPVADRGRAIGVWTGVGGAGAVLGMVLSALLVDTWGWRSLFVVPVVLVLVSSAVAWRCVPDSRGVAQRPFDVVGCTASVLGVVGLIFFFHEVPDRGWAAPGTITGLAVGVAGTAGFVAWQLRHPAPLLDVRLFRERGLGGGTLTLAAVFAVHAGSSVLLYPLLQTVFGFTSLLSAAALLPMAVLMMIASGFAPRLAARIGARATMAAGLGLTAAGLVLLAVFTSVEAGFPGVVPGLIALGIGMGSAMPPATEAITGALPPADQGVASALNDIARELGAAVGIALLGAMLAAGYRDDVGRALDGVPPATAAAARAGVANAVEAARGAGRLEQPLAGAASHSFVHALHSALWAGAVLVAVLLVVVLALLPKSPGTSPARGNRAG
ncbi:MFS transporter [Amycolatopsis sp. Hca4]|uniref:MFS transporter n=1 Tax=Amycolatopsis sp. Hca4 TaxID=2742131 RepID=UPI0015929F55|nr:MFS transporter [Amycolatopsis sp. Hca4]QKV74053.1 MFS transporter [Amycolatopsis sp. Hca4]